MQRWYKNFRDSLGRPVNGASVTVYEAGTQTLATIYEPDNNSVPASSKANPFTTDQLGNAAFAAANGSYDVQVIGSGVTVTERRINLIDGEDFYSDFAASDGSSLVGFIQEGTGAVARTVQDKLLESVSVKDFGAKGDGVTDDLIALNSAYTACIARGGGEIRIPSGYYRITGSWSIGAIPFDQFEFIMDRTAPVSDSTVNGHRIAGATTINSSYRGRPVTVVFEDGAYIVADFSPSVYTPVIGYYLDGDYRKQGGLVNPAVISMAMISAGEYNFDAVSVAQTNKLIGIWYNHGCKEMSRAFVAGCQFGVASVGAYWTRGTDLYVAWAGGDCLNIATANACEWTNLNFWNSARGIVYDGSVATVSGINCQGVSEEITVFACDELQIGPGYLEDTSATDGTGKYAIKLGQTGGDNTKVIGLRMFGLRNGSRRPNKKALRIYDTSYAIVENCRVLGGAVDVDSVSYGTIIGGDFSSSARIGKFVAINNGVSFLYSSPIGTGYGVYGPWMFNLSGITPGSIAAGTSYNYDYTLPAIADEWNNGGAFVSYTSGGDTRLSLTTRILFTIPKKVRITLGNPSAGAIDPGTFGLSMTVFGGI